MRMIRSCTGYSPGGNGRRVNQHRLCSGVRYRDTVMDGGCGHLEMGNCQVWSGTEFVVEVVSFRGDERREHGYV